jgi:hypothetical protein
MGRLRRWAEGVRGEGERSEGGSREGDSLVLGSDILLAHIGELGQLVYV